MILTVQNVLLLLEFWATKTKPIVQGQLAKVKVTDLKKLKTIYIGFQVGGF